MLSGWSVYSNFAQFRHPSVDQPWFIPYLAGLWTYVSLWFTFWAYQSALDSQLTSDLSWLRTPPTNDERRTCKLAGIQLILFGLVFLAGAVLMTRLEWESLHWREVKAVLVDKETKQNGALLTFSFDAAGQPITSRTARARGFSKESYSLGSLHWISYDPKDPSQIAVVPDGTRSSRAPFFAGAIGVSMIAAGLAVYRKASD
jgi:hypothetical protein